jgi:UDP-N-acetylmuramate dehydrogenase
VTPARGVSMAPHTSLRVGGAADYFFEARSCGELVEALRWGRGRGVAVRVIGGGSNLLVADDGVDGLVIKVVSAQWAVEGSMVRADAGVNVANMARRLAKQGWSGLEWAANVPGTVGGAVVNNAGAFGGDTASCVETVSIVGDDGVPRPAGPEALGYGYRTSVLKRRAFASVPGAAVRGDASDGRAIGAPTSAWAGDEGAAVAVVEATFRIERSTPEIVDGRIKEVNAQRMRTQPRILSAGSVFANPDGDFAGRLIEAAGLKGYVIGGAQISEQHANFIVNPGGATAHDVYALMQHARRVVFEQFGVRLRPEIELFGRWDE